MKKLICQFIQMKWFCLVLIFLKELYSNEFSKIVLDKRYNVVFLDTSLSKELDDKIVRILLDNMCVYICNSFTDKLLDNVTFQV